MAAFTGQNSSVTTSAAALGSSQAVAFYTLVKAASTNTQPVYVGFTNGVTSSTGIGLWAGDTLQIDPALAANVASVYVVSGSGTQTVHYMGA